MFALFNRSIDSLSNTILISSPMIADPRFEHTVTYICDHDENGAMGLIVNKRHDADWEALLKDIEIATQGGGEYIVLDGGPVEPERGIVIHDGDTRWESTFFVGEQLAITSTKDILSAMAKGEGPRNAQLVLGYAAWSAGQLEQELASDAWILVQPEEDRAITTLLFEIPAQHRWSWMLRQLDFDFYQLASAAGTA